ncbi:MAG: hypothetical protein N2A99_03130 [Carnobacterium alterfunditum]
MQVTSVKKIIHSEKGRIFSVIWFAVDKYPEDLFGLQKFTDVNLPAEYIIQEPQKHDEEKITDVKNNLLAIKGGITDKINESSELKLQLLFQKDTYPY